MQNQSPAAAAQRRAWNYWFDDGVPALVGGLGSVLFGLSFIFDHSLFRLVLMALYGVILLRNRLLIEWLKVRLTYPRTGYVTPPDSPQDRLLPLPDPEGLSLQADEERLASERKREEDAKKRLILSLAILLPAVLGTMFIESPWIYTVAGIALAASLSIMNGKDVRLSWFVLGGIPLIGLGMTFFSPQGLTPAHRLGYFSTAIGLLVVATGAVALVHHLWRNRVASIVAK
jgi:hypothetical protein